MNVIKDDANGYDGGLQLNDVGEYTFEVWLSVTNMLKLKLQIAELVSFWAEADGVRLDDSFAPTLTLNNGDFSYHTVHWKFKYNNLKKGTVIKLIGQTSSNPRVAYLKFGKDYPAGVIVYKNMIPVVGSDQLVK
ncbi:hypothetical protein [Vibrio campbellii]